MFTGPLPDYVNGRTQPVGYYQHNIFMAFLARADPRIIFSTQRKPDELVTIATETRL
jgi:hypothetical protein